jgi:FAD/FMN-containing dehydrogenase
MIDISEIKNKINGGVKTDFATLTKYSRDASIFEIRPQAVINPKNVEDVKTIVKWVAEKKSANPDLSVTARCAGTDMGGGSINDSLILDFTAHFDRIIKIGTDQGKQINTDGGFAIVEPGVYYRDFEKVSLEKNLILPCYTASKSLNTMGGMAANNSAGEKSLVYGQAKDFVEELDVVLSDGNLYTFGELDNHQLEQKLKLATFEGGIYRKMFDLVKGNFQLIQGSKPTTSKNSAGYLLWEIYDRVRFNLAKVIVGSQGTLGLITRVKYRLVKPKPKSELLVIFLKDLAPLGDLVKTVMQFKPESFESFDDHTFKLAMRFLPEIIKKMGGNIFSLGRQFLPEIWMTLTGGVPKLILIVEFTGETEYGAYGPLMAAKKAVEEKFNLKTHVTKSEREANKYWTVRRESFNLLRRHVKGMHTAPFIDDIIVHPRDLPEFLPRLDKILAKYPKLIYTVAGHMGDANFHIIPLMDLKDASNRLIIPKLAREVYGLVLEYHGSITAEHNDGLIRSPYLQQMFGVEMYSLFEETKRIFDPRNIFNPRKKVGSTIEYSMEHMIRD